MHSTHPTHFRALRHRSGLGETWYDALGAETTSDLVWHAPLTPPTRSARYLRGRHNTLVQPVSTHSGASPLSGRCETTKSVPTPPPTPHRAPHPHHSRAVHTVNGDADQYPRELAAHIAVPLCTREDAGRSKRRGAPPEPGSHAPLEAFAPSARGLRGSLSVLSQATIAYYRDLPAPGTLRNSQIGADIASNPHCASRSDMYNSRSLHRRSCLIYYILVHSWNTRNKHYINYSSLF